jgi:hypothetical protein
LYIPAGFVFCERTSASRTVGFRLGVVAKDEKLPGRLRPMLDHRLQQGQVPFSQRWEAVVAEVTAQVDTS